MLINFKSKNVHYAAFEANWYAKKNCKCYQNDGKRNYCKLFTEGVKFMIFRSQKPYRFDAAGIFHLTYSTLLQVIHLFLMLLNE